MAQNFIESRREQGFLLPPDVRDWLGPDHLAWFVIDAVEGMDLSAFYGAYRADGHGGAAYEPSVMVAVILFAFSTGVRSSRAIERHCREHVAFRVITGNLVPDHVTALRGSKPETMRGEEEGDTRKAEQRVVGRQGIGNMNACVTRAVRAAGRVAGHDRPNA